MAKGPSTIGGTTSSVGVQTGQTQGVQTNAPWGPAQPMLGTIANDALAAYKSGVGSQPYTSSMVVPFSNQTTQGLQGTMGTAHLAAPQFQGAYQQVAGLATNQGFDPLQQQSVTQLQNIAGGGMLTGNPYIDKVIASTSQDITRAGQMNASGAGRYGSGGYQGVTQRAVGDVSNQMRMANYDKERGYMQDAIGSVFNAGQQRIQNIAALPGQMQSAYQASLDPYKSMMGVGGMYEDLASRRIADQKRIFDEQQAQPWAQLGKLQSIAYPMAATGWHHDFRRINCTDRDAGRYERQFGDGRHGAAVAAAARRRGRWLRRYRQPVWRGGGGGDGDMSKRPRGIFDYAPKAAARQRMALVPTGDTDEAPPLLMASKPPPHSRFGRNTEKEKLYLAQRRLRGVADLAGGAFDLAGMPVNAAIRNIDYFTGGGLSGGKYDPYQFKDTSQDIANLASNIPGTKRIIPDEEVPEDIRQSGANQRALMGMLPIGPEAVVGPILGAVAPAARVIKQGGKIAKELEELPIVTAPNISSVKMRTPIKEIEPTYEAAGEMLPERLLHPESLFGSNIIPMRGDPTITGQKLTGMMGQKFEQPVLLPGGPGFSRGPSQIAEGAGWASNVGPSTTLSNRAALLTKQTGKPTHGVFMKMSEHSPDYAVHMAQVLHEQFKLNRPNITKEAIDAFDTVMREKSLGVNKKTGKADYPAYSDWPGIEKLTDDYIVRGSGPNKDGKVRTKMAKLMDTAKFRDLNFPESGAARFAVTERELLDVPSHSSGHSVVEFDPEGRVIKEPMVPHPTYAQQNVAKYKGRLPELPLDVLYGPEIRASTQPQYLAKILETKPPIVKMNQKTLDRVMAHLRHQDPSKWAVPLAAGTGAGAGVLAGGGEAQAAPAASAPRSPIAALDDRVMDEAYATRSSPRDVLKRMLRLP